jgi:hypothetical protein
MLKIRNKTSFRGTAIRTTISCGGSRQTGEERARAKVEFPLAY